MKKQIFLHTGLAKTGTKFLQHNFFPKLQNIHYIPKPLYYKSQKLIQKINKPKILVSQEYDQQFDDEIRKWAKFDKSTKVIIVFRRQDSWFVSEYKRFVKNGFRGEFTDFIDIERDGGYFRIKDGLYMPKIKLVEQLFDNPPFVLIYDELKNDPVRFLHKFALFLGSDFYLDDVSFEPRHRSYQERQLKFMKKVGYYFGVAIRPYNDENRFVRTIQRFSQMAPRYTLLAIGSLVPNFLLPKEPLIPPEELEKLRKFYESDWKQTVEYAQKVQSYYLGEL